MMTGEEKAINASSLADDEKMLVTIATMGGTEQCPDDPERCPCCHGDEYTFRRTVNLSSLQMTGLPDNDVCSCTKELYLDYNDFKQISVSLCHQLKHTVTLSIIGNWLQTLPDAIGELSLLERFYLQENNLQCLPDVITDLKNLKLLNVNGNEIVDLPDSFGQMSNLQELYIGENNISEIPESFGSLKNLRVLEVNDNKLTKLPESFGGLSALQVLNIASNKINILPQSFQDLPSVEEMDLSENGLNALPAAFASHRVLRRCYVESNYLVELPSWIGDLPELLEFSIRDNEIQHGALPQTLGEVSRRLTYLHLGGNHLSGLPASLSLLEELTYFNIGSVINELELRNFQNGNWIAYLPQDFGWLRNLREAHLDENQLRCLPDNFGDLRCLEFLNVAQNLLSRLPDSFCHLQRLRYVQFSKNSLTELPAEFGDLSSLEDLNLTHNQLKSLPESMSRLHRLKVLDLFDNKLIEVPGFIYVLPSLAKIDLELNLFDLNDVEIPENLLKRRTYHKRDPKWEGTWRGKCRADPQRNLAIKEYQVSEENWESDTEDSSPKPLKYDSGVMENAAWRNLSQGIWRSHSGPAVRHSWEAPPRQEKPMLLATHPEMYLDAEEQGSQEEAPQDIEDKPEPDQTRSHDAESSAGEFFQFPAVCENEDWDEELREAAPYTYSMGFCWENNLVIDDEHAFTPSLNHASGHIAAPKFYGKETGQFSDAESDS